jgi:spore maturation protein CgeB
MLTPSSNPIMVRRPRGVAAALPDTKIACVLDDFSYSCFEPECQLTQLDVESWRGQLEASPPDLLLVESAWRGLNGGWRWEIQSVDRAPRGALSEVVDWCRERGIPTVFWNKEDPPNFQHFVEATRKFDVVFTTDAHCIPAYRRVLGHENIWALPFAAQPVIHFPPADDTQRIEDVAFAGSWTSKYPQRMDQLEILLRPALKHGLHIYDRNYGTEIASDYQFPDAYQHAIKGRLSYPEMIEAYRRYRVFLNVNSVTKSPTMFSRRVFELLACGTAVISTPSVGVSQLLDGD